MSVVESLFLPVGFKFLRQRREYFDTVHQPAQPIALCLQRSIDRLRIQSRIDGGMGQALMVQDILNRREIFSGDRQVTRTGPPKIVDGHILHIPVSADLVPDLLHAAIGPRCPLSPGKTHSEVRGSLVNAFTTCTGSGINCEEPFLVRGFPEQSAPLASLNCSVTVLHPGPGVSYLYDQRGHSTTVYKVNPGMQWYFTSQGYVFDPLGTPQSLRVPESMRYTSKAQSR
jgi:hypothetical protein